MRPRAAVLFLLLAAAPAGAQDAVSSLKNHDSNAPVDITADRTELHDRENRVIFTGTVRAVQGDMVMDTQRMTVAYIKQADGKQQIQRIDGSGGVVVTSPSEVAKGSFGTYDLNRKLITLINNVTLTRGENLVRGARLTIDLNTGRSTVDGSPVGGGGGPGKGARVTGHFTVPQRSSTATPAQPAATPKK